MFQFKVYDASGAECRCSDCYRTARQAREAFHSLYPFPKEVGAVLIDCVGYKFVAEKPVGRQMFRRCQ